MGIHAGAVKHGQSSVRGFSSGLGADYSDRTPGSSCMQALAAAGGGFEPCAGWQLVLVCESKPTLSAMAVG